MFSKNEWLLRKICCCFVRSMNIKVRKLIANNEKSKDQHLHAFGDGGGVQGGDGEHGDDGGDGGVYGCADGGVRGDSPNPNSNRDINLDKTKSDTPNNNNLHTDRCQETGSEKTNSAHSIDIWNHKKSENNNNNSNPKNDDKIECEKDEPCSHSQQHSQFSAIEKQLAHVIQSEND